VKTASADELVRAKRALTLIRSRGYHRGRDLLRDLDTITAGKEPATTSATRSPWRRRVAHAWYTALHSHRPPFVVERPKGAAARQRLAVR
jgi:hypothetical protein